MTLIDVSKLGEARASASDESNHSKVYYFGGISLDEGPRSIKAVWFGLVWFDGLTDRANSVVCDCYCRLYTIYIHFN